MSLPDAVVGSWILDQYRVTRVLATGGMGTIYLAEQPSMERQAVIKTIRSRREGTQSSEDLKTLFQREARAVSRLGHPNIVTVYNFGTLDDGTLFLAMEYVDGVGIDKLLSQGPISPIRAVNLIYQCSSALEYAHRMQIVHRDFKPENLMLKQFLGRDHIKILDFGVARIQTESALDSTGSILIGTPQYLSPEACRSEPVAEAADQYQLGLVMYEMLTARAAFSAPTVLGYLKMHASVLPPPPSTIMPDPAVRLLDDIVMRMLRKDPRERYPSMEALETDLARAADQVNTKKQLHAVLTWAAEERFVRGAPFPVEEAYPRSLSEQSSQEQTSPRQTLPEPASPEPASLEPGSPERASLEQTSPKPAPLGRAETTRPVKPGVEHRTTIRQAASLISGRLLWTDGSFPDDQTKLLAKHGMLVEKGIAGFFADEDESYRVLVAGNEQALQLRARAEGFPDDRLLYCLTDPAPDTSFRDCNVLLGRPSATAIIPMVERMHGNPTDGLELFVSAAKPTCCEVSELKHQYDSIDKLNLALAQAGVRRVARESCQEIASELIVNAIVHNSQGGPPDTPPELSNPAMFRWAIGRYVVISVKDSFGCLAPETIWETILAREASPTTFGYTMIVQAADYVFFFLSPGKETEIVALVDSERSRRSNSAATVGIVITAGSRQELSLTQIGDRLWIGGRIVRNSCKLWLKGQIDHSCDLSNVFSHADDVELNLQQVSAMNSMGARRWLAAREQSPSSQRLSITGCPSAVVRQVGLLPTLLKAGEIRSVALGYHCEQCGGELTRITKVDQIVAQQAPKQQCAQCGSDLTCDEDSSSFFQALGKGTG